MEKICSKCGETKPLTDYRAQSSGKHGRRAECKMCSIKLITVPRAAPLTPEQRKIKNQQRYEANRQIYGDRVKAWRTKNPDYSKNYSREYFKSPLNRAKLLWTKAKNRSENFTLTLARVEVSLMIGVCERTGIKFDFDAHAKHKVNPFSPSLDRKDAYGPYSDENIQIVCSAYNYGKNQMTDDDYVEFCRKVVMIADQRKPR